MTMQEKIAFMRMLGFKRHHYQDIEIMGALVRIEIPGDAIAQCQTNEELKQLVCASIARFQAKMNQLCIEAAQSVIQGVPIYEPSPDISELFDPEAPFNFVEH